MDARDQDERELRRALEALARPSVRTGCRRISAADLADLREAEAGAVRRAVPSRRQEFASGRALLRELSGHDGAIEVAADRSPVLPWGVRGSLAHDREFAVAAVSKDPTVLALGIDIEPATPLEADVAAVVLRHDDGDIDAHLAFTMKEAAYKAWSALGGRMLDHDDVRIAVTGSRFEALIVEDGSCFDGSWGSAAGRWLALVVVRRPAQPAC